METGCFFYHSQNTPKTIHRFVIAPGGQGWSLLNSSYLSAARSTCMSPDFQSTTAKPVRPACIPRGQSSSRATTAAFIPRSLVKREWANAVWTIAQRVIGIRKWSARWHNSIRCFPTRQGFSTCLCGRQGEKNQTKKQPSRSPDPSYFLKVRVGVITFPHQ